MGRASEVFPMGHCKSLGLHQFVSATEKDTSTTEKSNFCQGRKQLFLRQKHNLLVIKKRVCLLEQPIN